MSKNIKTSHSGFTLVELAISLMIIGLLLGGVLKGKELWENTRVLAQVRQIEGYKAAIVAFRSSYGALPGDMRNPQDRVPDCLTAPCSNTGDGNGFLTFTGLTSIPVASAENRNFWLHMAKAGLISDIDVSSTKVAYDATFRWGPEFPKTQFEESGITAWGNDTNPLLGAPHTMDPGNMMITNTVDYWSIPTMPVKYAQNIDRKMDDGRPWTGIVHAVESVGGRCYTGGGAYNTTPVGSYDGCHLAFTF